MNIFSDIINNTNRDNYPSNYDTGYSLPESIARLIASNDNFVNEFKKSYDEIRKANNNNEINYNLINELSKKLVYIEENIKNISIKDKSITFNKLSNELVNQIINLIDNNITYQKLIKVSLDGTKLKYDVPKNMNSINFKVNDNLKLIIESEVL